MLVVVDVQDGYDSKFIASLGSDQPGSLGYLSAIHDVDASYELVSRKEVKKYAKGEMQISYDKVGGKGGWEGWVGEAGGYLTGSSHPTS